MQEFENPKLHNDPLESSAIALGTGPLVLCLHGFPDNARSSRHQLPVLAEAGDYMRPATIELFREHGAEVIAD